MTPTATAPHETPNAGAPDVAPAEDAPDFDLAERQSAGRVEELRTERQRLALPALTDSKAAKELRDVQDRLSAALVDVENVALARMQAQALAEKAERERVEATHAKARGEARKYQTELAAAALTYDNAAKKLVEALCAFSALRVDLINAMGRANARALNIPASAPEAALVHALHQANAPRGALEFAGVAARPQALAASVPPLPIGDES